MATYSLNTVGVVRSSSVFEEATKQLFCGLRIINRTSRTTLPHSQDHQQQLDRDESPMVSKASINALQNEPFKTGMTCSLCQVLFESCESQRDHFKLDWHRFNLKQRMMGKPVVTEVVFEETVSGDMSSLSGSDTETDDDLSLESHKAEMLASGFAYNDDEDKENEKRYGRCHPKIFLINEDGLVLSVFQTVVYSTKNIPETPEDVVAKVTCVSMEKYWMILMTAGGHFAGAVFNGSSIVCHKTFHRYTVRAKRGMAQGARDNQQGGKQPKSAGASLRRYNEAALLQEVQDLLESWTEHIEKADRIFVRTPTYNKSMFFGSKKPPFKKDDPRLRSIPFATRRPTFNEVKRVHAELSTVEILGKEEDVLQSVVDRLHSTQMVSKTSKTCSQITKKTTADKSCSDTCPSSSVTDDVNRDQEDVSDGVERKTRSPSITKIRKKGKGKKLNKDEGRMLKIPTPADAVSPRNHLWNRLYCACVAGNMEVLSKFFCHTHEETKKKEESTESEIPECRDNPPDLSFKVELTETLGDAARKVPVLENNALADYTERTSSFKTEQSSDAPGKTEEDIAGVERTVDEVTVSEAGLGLQVLNEKFGEDGGTLMHAAARSSQTEVVQLLLLGGGDPAVRDDRGKTPYNMASNKQTRNEFRRFMALYPDRYNYEAAQIPSPLTTEAEEEKERKANQRKKAQRKARKEKLKEQKVEAKKKEEEEMKKKEEEKERQTFMALNEREKRALAAERRFAQQQASRTAFLSCSFCSKRLANQVPFERLTHKYCSTACVQAHRKALENELNSDNR